ncbi:MAG: tetratricopeptide repeat protein [Paludibacter sp.]|nr:tetratricopeptide repeat protein [Paludibacter sp.]
MRKIVFIVMLSLLTFSAWSQKESDDVRKGNKLYKSSKFTEAEIAYRKGLIKNPKSFEANYNLGNALFRQKKYKEALDQYNNSIALKPNEKEKIAAAYHNTGNSLLADQKIEESIKAYEMALKNNPKDNETRYNLAYAQTLLKKQQQQNKQDKKKNKPDDEADKIMKRAKELVAERKYQEAYDLMKNGERTNKSLLKYADFTNRILNVIKLK